jgi:hypothetical protein
MTLGRKRLPLSQLTFHTTLSGFSHVLFLAMSLWKAAGRKLFTLVGV